MLFVDAYRKYIDEHARDYYDASGWKLHETILHSFRRMYPDLDANGFRPRIFEEWRKAHISGHRYKTKDGRWVKPLCRSTLNQRMTYLMLACKWMVRQDIMEPMTLFALQCCERLKPGKSRAVEPEPLGPVDRDDFYATLKFITNNSLRDLLELIYLSGMRPGEAFDLRPEDIDTTRPDGVWVYVKKKHKTARFGKDRAIFFGPRCKEILERQLRKKRLEKGPVFRNDRGIGWTDGSASYRLRSIFSKHPELTPWVMRQLRKSTSTLVHSKYGPLAESAFIGHSPAVAMQFYTARDYDEAARIALEVA